ncbi:MAG: glutamate-cysteine ligase family protein [Coriobacteriia bacterium]|nr:glutamate-cysteine ligase family protein [Coriobacteriia bacterium]
MPADGFRFGLEDEFSVVDSNGRFLDFSNTTFDELDRVIEKLPVFDDDYRHLRVGDLGIKLKRWYIEGFERFTDEGEYIRTDPKGFEIRTPICPSLDEALATLEHDMERWRQAAEEFGYQPIRTALNPLQREYIPTPPLNEWEIAHRQTPEEQTAHIHMLTYGPDISFSHPDLTIAEAIDIGKKLTYYSPLIVPFSFTSPFFEGRPWGGYSRRTFHRTGPRPSVLVHVGSEGERVASFPTLTDLARLPAEVGRIEFKAFDCPPHTGLYMALGMLLLGIALDESLPGRATVPDAESHRHSAMRAFDDDEIRSAASNVLEAARAALPGEWRWHLEPLVAMLDASRTPAHAMLDIYHDTGDVLAAIGG